MSLVKTKSPLSQFCLKARANAIFQQSKIGYNTFTQDRVTSFISKYTMTKEELEHMIQCAKETRQKKTW